MYIALFSVAFGSLLTFVQAVGLFHLLDLEAYVSYRAVINTMNVAAPFLCIGFDTSAPVLKRQDPDVPFLWNILAVHFMLFCVFFTVSILLPHDSRLMPLASGLAASTTVAAAIIVANYHRVEGAMRKYFIGINIVDKTVRAVIILSAAFFLNDIMLWSAAVSIASLVYVALTAYSTRSQPILNLTVFRKHVRVSFPFIFASLGIIAMTRLPFYASYFFDEHLVTAKIDIWLLFSLFVLMPVLNKSKIEESNSTGIGKKYLAGMRGSWGALKIQEALICSGISVVSFISVMMGYSESSDLYGIVLPLLTGMIIIASVPNYVQLVCFLGKYSLGIKISLLVFFAALIAYIPLASGLEFSIPNLFIISAFIYCLIGCSVAKGLGIEIKDFWRWKSASQLVLLCAVILCIFEMYLMA